GDSYSGALSRVSGENAGLYEILQGSLVLPNNYDVTYVSSDFEILKATPVLTWENPADIFVGTALSATQLNATADVDGTFDYDPNMGTVLAVGDNQALYVLFTPTDITNYNTAEETVFINVLLDSEIFEIETYMRIYPNPTTDLIWVNYSDCLIYKITLIDMTGKVVLKEDSLSDMAIIDLSELPAGVYIIQVDSNKGPITEKIIKR
ncbi:MAG: T9SS type A sorting domain-containing protein, partial [Bacteroidales bacterium]|nr:T9SS type A sorting domain-containing protein [Bacteroidales bacterium]